MSILVDWNNEPEKLLIAQNRETKKLLSNHFFYKDIWKTVEDLGLKINQHNKVLSLNFKYIEQDWLKLLVKLYILIRSKRVLSAKGIKNSIGHLNHFSKFISTKSVDNPNKIDNQLFEELDYYLHSIKGKSTKDLLSSTTISYMYCTIKGFFDICREEKWTNVNTYWFKGKYQNNKPNNDDVETIPEEVFQQLDEHINHLPESVQRSVLIIRCTGLRIGELLNLPFDCLRRRKNQWHLRFISGKYRVVDELPICEELVTIVKEQQIYIRHHFGNTFDYLINSNYGGHHYKPAPNVMNSETFNQNLNKLAEEYNICDRQGNIWRFKSHQFRKTIATILTNAGVRDLIIQKYLRHRSSDMLDYYKKISKEVLEEEYEELIKKTKYYDSTGKLIKTYKPKNVVTEILRRKMYQVTTQYGQCHRPELKSPCQTVNACWRCEHWVTSNNDLDYLKIDLENINNEIETIKNLGKIRQEEILKKDRQILVRIIQVIEEDL